MSPRIAAAALFVLAAWPACAAELDLARAVETALARNPALLAVEEVRSQVAGGIREAKADAYPQLSLVSSWGQSRNPAFLNSPDFEELLDQFPAGSFEPSVQELHRGVIELAQPVWTFGKVGAAVELAEIVAQAAEAQISTARLDTAAAAAESYFQVLAARQGLATLEGEREFRRRDLERIDSLLEIGEATRLEQLRARAALAEVEPEVARRRGLVAVAETRLRQVLALPADEPLELAAVEGRLPEPPAPEALVARALAVRPELDDLARQQEVYVKRGEITRADGKPRLDLNGSWGREARVFDKLSDPLYDAWSVSVELNWSFFDGGRRKGQVEQFESQRRQLGLRRADLESRVRLETSRAHSDFVTARARAAAAEVSAAVAREALRVARESYEQGVATQTDLLDAQSRSTSAEVLAVESFFDARIQASRLARAVGRYPTASWTSSAEN